MLALSLRESTMEMFTPVLTSCTAFSVSSCPALLQPINLLLLLLSLCTDIIIFQVVSVTAMYKGIPLLCHSHWRRRSDADLALPCQHSTPTAAPPISATTWPLPSQCWRACTALFLALLLMAMSMASPTLEAPVWHTLSESMLACELLC